MRKDFKQNNPNYVFNAQLIIIYKHVLKPHAEQNT